MVELQMKAIPFLIVRPSGLPFLDQILHFVAASNLEVLEEFEILDWTATARCLYRDKFGSSYKLGLQPGAESWLAASRMLFGNRAKLFTARAIDGGGDESTLILLSKLKIEFRRYMKPVKRHLTIGFSCGEKEFPVFFDYIHTPDPILARLATEWSWLLDDGRLSMAPRPLTTTPELPLSNLCPFCEVEPDAECAT